MLNNKNQLGIGNGELFGKNWELVSLTKLNSKK